MGVLDFVEWPKISRFSRDIIVTEKIDGSNGQIKILLRAEVPQEELDNPVVPFFSVTAANIDYIMLAGSRNKWISENNDNAGFAKWVSAHRDELVTLGPGSHFGEWWGSGIQRGYGLTKGEKRFSLFNVSRWTKYSLAGVGFDKQGKDYCPDCCHVVPILYKGPFEAQRIDEALVSLQKEGSRAARGFMRPEGIIIFHTVSGHLYKKTIEKDHIPKSKA